MDKTLHWKQRENTTVYHRCSVKSALDNNMDKTLHWKERIQLSTTGAQLNLTAPSLTQLLETNTHYSPTVDHNSSVVTTTS
jgi:hypothetical protein